MKLCAGVAALLLCLPEPGVAQVAASNAPVELSLEDLINIQVTSVSKKETPLNQSPAAISVITQEDIRRSGLTSIPELLRLVPGMDVAQISANEWAVSSRGFNGQYANKLLVMVDGRSVYNPVFAGVYWNVQDLVLEDLDRIEVIRGPGATLWGANAVNGVINIITKSAKETQGLLVSTTAGTQPQPETSLRYGGQVGTNLFYRVYLKYAHETGFEDAAGNGTPDASSLRRGGVRLDWEPFTGDVLTLQGDYYNDTFNQLTTSTLLAPPFTTNFTAQNDSVGENVLARWTHDFSESSQLTLQGYYDHAVTRDADYKGIVDTYDFDLQHRFALGERQDIVWGAGYRYVPTHNSDASFITWTRNDHHDQLFSGFVQDDIAVVEKRLHLTLGTKIEHNDYTGFEVEPSARLMWTPTEKQTVWAAVSRAVRTPSQFERDASYNATVQQPSPAGPPVLVRLLGDRDFNSEELTAYELGYRIEPARTLSLDLAAFYTVYGKLKNTESGGAPYVEAVPAPLHLVVPEQPGDGQTGNTYGAELSAQWRVTDNWQLTASYSWLHMNLTPDTGASGSTAANSPQHQAQLHSSLDLPHHLEFDGSLYYVERLPLDGAITASGVPSGLGIPGYVRLDLGLVWRPCKSWEFSVWGQNLLQDRHEEMGGSRTTQPTEVPRSFYAKITWRF